MKALSGICIFLALIATLVFLFAGNIISQEEAKVVLIAGNPQVMKFNTNNWDVCKIGMTIENGDRIKTLEGERVDISFAEDNTNIIEIGEESDVVVKKGQAPYAVELLNGEVMALLKRLPKDSTFEVRTPAGLSGARGTGWGSKTDGNKTTFAAYENSIYARGIDRSGNVIPGELIVKNGWKTVIGKFQKPERLERLMARDMDRWNSWKDSVASFSGMSQKQMENRLQKVSGLSGRSQKLQNMAKEGNVERKDIDRVNAVLQKERSSYSH
ncbi:MAG: FecR family protein [Candidatus Omnitrophica bacterium]|nr:FecR family protein [Candidatus Omnitrophota bacterium]